MDILEGIKIASPCSADWNEMYGDENRRFCGQCRLNVYYLPGMPSKEVEDLLLRSEGRICVRLYERSDGTFITENCPVGLAAARLKVRRIATAAVSLVASFLIGVGAGRLVNGPTPESPTISTPSPPAPKKEERPKISFGGMVANLDEIKAEILHSQDAA